MSRDYGSKKAQGRSARKPPMPSGSHSRSGFGQIRSPMLDKALPPGAKRG